MKKKFEINAKNSKYVFEQLEAQELMFGGIEGLVISDVVTPSSYIYSDAESSSKLNDANFKRITNHETQTQEVVFVDTAVENYQSLIDDILINSDGNIDVILLDSSRNGIIQISEVLNRYENLDAIHIIAHGSDGSINLGNTTLNQNSLQENQLPIISWAGSFNETGDILIYGCNLAQTDLSKSLINSLSELTLTDVAACDDLTGHASLGGDCQLAYQRSSIKSATVFCSSAQDAWVGSLSSLTNSLSSSQDTFIELKKTKAENGSLDTMTVNRETTDRQHSLLQFDLSSIPDGATIQSATIKLEAISIDGDLTIAAYKLLGAWNEVEANWDESSLGNNWSTAGGSINASALDSFVTETTEQHYFDISALAQDWVDGGAIFGGLTELSAENRFSSQSPLSSAYSEFISYATGSQDEEVWFALEHTSPTKSHIESAIIEITGNYTLGEDLLSFTTQNGITGDFDVSTGTSTLSGSASLNEYQEAIRSVTYTNQSENPNTDTRTLTFTVNDNDNSSKSQTRSITVSRDSITAVADVYTLVSGAPIVINPVENDTDAQNDELSVVEIIDTANNDALTILSSAGDTAILTSGTTIELRSDGRLNVTASSDGTQTFNYRVSDGSESDVETVTLNTTSDQATAQEIGFVTTWDTSLPGSSANDTIELLVNSGSDNYTVYWGDGTSTTGASGNTSHTYDVAGIYTIAIVGDMAGFAFDNSGDVDKITSIEQWGNVAFENLANAFDGASNLVYNANDLPDLSGVTDLSDMFSESSFNGDISNWDTSNVTHMTSMFCANTVFNQDISNWDTSSVVDMSAMFAGASAFNQNIGTWETGSVQNMANMFNGAASFNQNIGNWDTRQVTNMSAMFMQASTFNQDIGGWETGNVSDMEDMFNSASQFNQNIATVVGGGNHGTSAWDTNNTLTMAGMFKNATAFNQDISSWDTAAVFSMSDMFNAAQAFNQNISSWETSRVTSMQNMFLNATSFDQSLGELTILFVTDMSDMLSNSGLSTNNYDATLIGWASQVVQSNVTLGANGLVYSEQAIAPRDSLIDNDSWIITGDTTLNDAPTYNDTLDSNPTFVEDGLAVVIDEGINLTDAELDLLNSSNGNYSGSKLTLARNISANGEDVFAFNNGNGISLLSGNLYKNSQIIATFDTQSTPGELLIAFTDANGEIPNSVDINNIQRQITYENTSDTPPESVQIDWTFNDGNDGSQGIGNANQALGNVIINISKTNDVSVIIDLSGDTLDYIEGDGEVVIDQLNDALPTTGDRTVRFVLTDGDGGISENYDTTISVTPVNDAPTLDLNLNDSSTTGNDFKDLWTQGGGSILITDSDAVLSDVDSANLASLVVSISNLWDGADEYLSADTTGTDIIASYDNITGELTLSGIDSLANYEQVLRTISYDNTHASPVGQSRIIEFVAFDGNEYSETALATIRMATQVNVLVVTNTSDNIGGDTSSIEALLANTGGDGISLREAILAANNSANGSGPDVIRFDVAGEGPHTITLTSALPVITDTVIIDGSSEPDFAGTPMVILDGNSIDNAALTLGPGASGSTIHGLIIRDADFGIWVQNGSNNNIISGNWIGQFNADGSDAGASNIIAQDAILIEGGNNTIGGTTPGDRNVIIGGIYFYESSAANNTVSGNFFGTDRSGNALLASSSPQNGITATDGANNNIIGGITQHHRNIFGGLNDALHIGDAGTEGFVIQNNWIGLGADGTTILSNDVGMLLYSGSNHTIGGMGNGNVVMGSARTGIWLLQGSENVTIQGNYVGTNESGSVNASNNIGIRIDSNSTNILIGGVTAGQGNVITANTGAGILTDGEFATFGNSFLGNHIFNNDGLGIDINNEGVTNNDLGDGDIGGNNLQNYPLLVSAISNGTNSVVFNGSLNTNANTTYRIEFFANATADENDHGEAERFIGFTNVTTDEFGNANFSEIFSKLMENGEIITATATVDFGNGSYGDTSEFAANIEVEVNQEPVIIVPDTLIVDEDTLANILGISISDVDGNLITTQLSVTNGVLNVNLTSGATINDGSNNSLTMTLSGNQAQINAALATLTYQGNQDFNGNDSLAIVSRDSGNTSPSTSDSLNIIVNPINDMALLSEI